MKALNRAIARTVSQLARYGREGCHPPMLFALEQHLDVLLTMERKQLEQVPGKLVEFTVSVPPVKWTPEMVAAFNRMEPVQLRTESIITGGKRLGKSEVDRLLRTPVEKWTSDQLAWFKANVVLSNAELDRLEARWKAATTQAEIAPGETASDPHEKPVQWYQNGVHGLGDLGLRWTPSAASEQPAPPAPDVINMADPRNWQAGDVVRRKCDGSMHFTKGNQYRVYSNDNNRVRICDGRGMVVAYPHGKQFDGAQHFFTWLSHSEAQQ